MKLRVTAVGSEGETRRLPGRRPQARGRLARAVPLRLGREAGEARQARAPGRRNVVGRPRGPPADPARRQPSETTTEAEAEAAPTPTLEIADQTLSDGQQVTGLALWRVDVTGSAARVEFWIDGKLRGTDLQRPFTLGWDTAAETPGEHSLEARAFGAGRSVKRRSRSASRSRFSSYRAVDASARAKDRVGKPAASLVDRRGRPSRRAT